MPEKTISIVEIHQKPNSHGTLIWGAGEDQDGIKRWAVHLKTPEIGWDEAFTQCQERITEMFFPKEEPETPPAVPDTPEKEPPAPQPKKERKISVERLKGILDNVGYSLAQDNDMKTDEKVKRWVNMLKWALPLIPDEEQSFKSHVQNAINNPSIWDFTKKPKHF